MPFLFLSMRIGSKLFSEPLSMFCIGNLTMSEQPNKDLHVPQHQVVYCITKLVIILKVLHFDPIWHWKYLEYFGYHNNG